MWNWDLRVDPENPKNNILVDTSLEPFYVDPSLNNRHLETSTLYQYVITAIDSFGNEESSGSTAIVHEETTKDEYVPVAPENLTLTTESNNQNQITLNWDPVEGYPIIGGAAVIYNIYRYTLDNFDINNITGIGKTNIAAILGDIKKKTILIANDETII